MLVFWHLYTDGSRAETTRPGRARPFLSLCGRIARSPALFSLKCSAAQAYRDEFTAALIRQAAGALSALCQKHAKDLPGHLRAAIAYRARKVQLQRRAHARFVSWLGLRPMAEADKVTALESLAPTIYLPSLSTPYPDLFHWVCETAEIAELWDDWVHKAKLADQRMSRRPMLIEDPEKLAIIIAADQNAIIRDSETGEIVALVIRDWCADPAVVVWVNSVVAQAVGLKRHIRVSISLILLSLLDDKSAQKEDPGKLVLMAVSSNFALFFNSMDACLPNELLTDLREYLRSNNLCRMDGNRAMGAGAMGMSVLRSEGSEVIAFAHEKLAPPSGVMGANYAGQFIGSTTPTSSATRGQPTEHDCGGSFYVASHGIKVEQAANTFIAWQPRLPHGTSMLACKPQQMEAIHVTS
ncbi:hypothetical protein C8Q72DRAFT_898264 [Fomitopsis betulina]|nr:hypothetical protein C8Q72DRAFT_898264 [Fomitopsis betulina]